MIVIALGAVLRIVNLNGVLQRTPDERNYTWEAATLLQQGAAGIHTIVAAQPENLSLPSPTRAGYLFVLAATMQLTGQLTPEAGAELSCAASIVSLLLLAVLAWRIFSPLCAIASVALLAASPLALMTARRSWQEACVEALSLAVLWLAFEIALGRRTLGWLAAFALLGGYSVTVKEVAALGFLLCVAAALFVLFRHGETRTAWLLLGLCAFTSVLALGWLAWLLGGVPAMLSSYTQTAKFLNINAYSIAYEAGSPWQLLHAFWSVAPLAIPLAILALACAAIRSISFAFGRLRTLAPAGYAAVFLLLAVALPHHINLRYLCVVFAPLYLLAGVGLLQGISLVQYRLPPRAFFWPEAAALLLLLVFCALDYRTFRQDFAVPDVQDLSLRMVLAATRGASLPSAAQPSTLASGAPSGQLSAVEWLNLSVTYAQAHQPQRSIEAAQRCLQLDPQNATAWNNIAADYEDLHQWDAAIDAANHALQIQPDFSLARNNLNWALSQRRLRKP